MECVHRWRPAMAVRGTDVEGFFEVRFSAACAECGTPLKFGEQLKVEGLGLVGVTVGEAAGD